MSGEITLAVEISEDRKHAAIVAAGREKITVDGEEQAGARIVVDLVWYDHPRDAVTRLAALGVKHDPVATVVDPRSQAGTLLRPLAEAGVFVTQPSTADVACAHGNFLDLVNDGRLAHLSQPPLTSAVQAAQQRPLAGAQAWERRITIDQSPLVAATLACWAFRRWEELAQPSVWAILGGIVRLSGCLLAVALLGLIGGAFLVGTWMVGLALMADSLLLGLWALFRAADRQEQPPPSVHEVPSLHDVLERARRSA